MHNLQSHQRRQIIQHLTRINRRTMNTNRPHDPRTSHISRKVTQRIRQTQTTRRSPIINRRPRHRFISPTVNRTTFQRILTPLNRNQQVSSSSIRTTTLLTRLSRHLRNITRLNQSTTKRTIRNHIQLSLHRHLHQNIRTNSLNNTRHHHTSTPNTSMARTIRRPHTTSRTFRRITVHTLIMRPTNLLTTSQVSHRLSTTLISTSNPQRLTSPNLSMLQRHLRLTRTTQILPRRHTQHRRLNSNNLSLKTRHLRTNNHSLTRRRIIRTIRRRSQRTIKLTRSRPMIQQIIRTHTRHRHNKRTLNRRTTISHSTQVTNRSPHYSRHIQISMTSTRQPLTIISSRRILPKHRTQRKHLHSISLIQRRPRITITSPTILTTLRTRHHKTTTQHNNNRRQQSKSGYHAEPTRRS